MQASCQPVSQCGTGSQAPISPFTPSIKLVPKHAHVHGLPALSLLLAGYSWPCPQPEATRTGVLASVHHLGPSVVPVLKWG